MDASETSLECSRDDVRGQPLPTNADPRRRIRLGFEYGVSFAIVLVLFAGGVWLSSESPPLGPVSFGQLAIYYLVGGALGGGVGGALYPLAEKRVGSALLGALVLLPFGFMVTFTIAGFQDVLRVTISSALGSLLLGAPCGVAILHHRRKSD